MTPRPPPYRPASRRTVLGWSLALAGGAPAGAAAPRLIAGNLADPGPAHVARYLQADSLRALKRQVDPAGRFSTALRARYL